MRLRSNSIEMVKLKLAYLKWTLKRETGSLLTREHKTSRKEINKANKKAIKKRI